MNLSRLYRFVPSVFIFCFKRKCENWLKHAWWHPKQNRPSSSRNLIEWLIHSSDTEIGYWSTLVQCFKRNFTSESETSFSREKTAIETMINYSDFLSSNWRHWDLTLSRSQRWVWNDGHSDDIHDSNAYFVCFRSLEHHNIYRDLTNRKPLSRTSPILWSIQNILSSKWKWYLRFLWKLSLC